MNTTKNDLLRVAGAEIYYEVRGSGPMLLVIQGGDGDADGTTSLVEHLTNHYTVITYDRRGLSRSKCDEVPAEMRLELHSEDIRSLLAALTTDPVRVFGSSIGALIGLDLVTRHPEQVHTFVAHEPPATELLPPELREQAAQGQLEIEAAYSQEGLMGAMRKFLQVTGISVEDREPDVVLPEPNPRRMSNIEFFLSHDAKAVRLYRLNMDALKAAPTHIVPAGGRNSRENWVYQCAAALADQLGTALVEFPGGHNGYVTHPKAFAAKLREVLGVAAEMK